MLTARTKQTYLLRKSDFRTKTGTSCACFSFDLMFWRDKTLNKQIDTTKLPVQQLFEKLSCKHSWKIIGTATLTDSWCIPRKTRITLACEHCGKLTRRTL